ncbi:MAG: hypothetical protein HFJ60_06955 [Clostridia bacterium]|jgi:hypothetical protein|nr:hypothetical protein [Clostridia bacterium]
MTKVLEKQLVDTKKAQNIIITTLIIIGAFVVPTFLAKIIPLGKYQQIIVGSIVNMSLILTALYTKGTVKTIAIATLPSMSTILGGLIFKDITLYSKTMIPAIWIGNFSFIMLYKLLYVNKKVNYPISAIIAIIVKAAIIYLGFTIMVNIMTVPMPVKTTLNTAMGVTQLITATSGSILAFLVVISTKIRSKE